MIGFEVVLALLLSVLFVRSASSTPAHVSSSDETAPDPLLVAASRRALAAARRNRTIALVVMWLLPLAHVAYELARPRGGHSGGPLAGLVTVAVFLFTVGGECVLALVATVFIVWSVRAGSAPSHRAQHGPLARDGTLLRPPTRF